MKRLGIAAFAALAITAGTAAPSGADSAPSKCVSDTQYFNDSGSKYCVDTTGDCLVSEWRTTFLGTDYYCDVRNPL